MTLLSKIYDVALKRDIENKAKQGFIRPTLSEHFMTDHDFVNIPKVYDYFGSEERKNQVTVSSQYSSSFPGTRAFDGGSGYWVISGFGSSWIKWDFLESKKVKEFRFLSGGTNPFPKDLTIEGSDTGNFSGEQIILGNITLNYPGSNAWSDWFPVDAYDGSRYLKINILNCYPVNNQNMHLIEVQFRVY